MFRETTIYDIAEALGLSAATVSRALRDHPAIHENTKKLVRKKAEETGYRFNSFASNLRRKKTNTLGVIVPRLNSNFMSGVLSEMERVANDAGYNLLIMQSLESMQKEVANALTMFNSRVDGLLVSLAYDTTDYVHFNRFIERKIPVLFFDRVPEDAFGVDNVVINNFEAGKEATRHLLENGCRCIMHVTGDLKRNVYADRYRGFLSALDESGVVFSGNMLQVNDLSQEAGAGLASYIHKEKNKPDGIFLANDLCAVSFIQAFKEYGYKIPGDIAVVGFNDDPVSRFIDPQLTTVRYPGAIVGEKAVNALIGRLDGISPSEGHGKIVVPHQLVIRGSSVPVPPGRPG